MTEEREQNMGCYYCYCNADCLCPRLIPDCENCLMHPGNYEHLLGAYNSESMLNPGCSVEIGTKMDKENL